MKKVVVTGLGVVSSVGIGWKPFWDSLIAGKSGISLITAFDTTGFTNSYGGQIKKFDPEKFIDHQRVRKMARESQMAVAAARMAVDDAQLSYDSLDPYRTGVIVGTTNGEFHCISDMVKKILNHQFCDIEEELRMNPVIPLNVASELGFYGPNLIIPTACAAGNYAIGYGYDLILLGKTDVMVCGGVDALAWLAFVGFNRLGAYAPGKCQPFDKNRKGILTAEGSGMVVLESLEGAKKRNAPIYAEIKGYGLSCDAYHMTMPLPEGMARVMENALMNAGIRKEDVDYINAHGTGTPANDKSETRAIQIVFGSDYKKIPVSSIKSMLGHSMGAASALEAVSTILSVKFNIIPPTINYETHDPECDIDCVPNEARNHHIDIALNNSFAFGGNNASLVFGKLS